MVLLTIYGIIHKSKFNVKTLEIVDLLCYNHPMTGLSSLKSMPTLHLMYIPFIYILRRITIDMSVQVENLEHNMAKLTIEVAAEELEKALDSAYQKQKKQISVPGFRKGKVPRAMIEKMYGAGVFYEDAANILMQQTYAGAVDESGVDIVSRPTVEVTQIEKGQPFIYTAEVAVRPEVTLGKYMGVTVTKIDTSVSDEEVDAELENQRNKMQEQLQLQIVL